jgi:putative endonuclease
LALDPAFAGMSGTGGSNSCHVGATNDSPPLTIADQVGFRGRSIMSFFVYILANRRNGTLYVGMTDDLVKRVWMHKEEVLPGFTKDYDVKLLVWYEVHDSRESAFIRERQIKKWNRVWKLELIEKTNSSWRDLYDEIAN